MKASASGKIAVSAKPTASSQVRERLVAAATELFYTNGLRVTSVEKVIERAGTTKVTFYRHFRSKEDLAVAYLEGLARREREGVQAAVSAGAGDAEESLRLISQGIGAMACSPGFRGCPFINAAAEYPDPNSPVRKIVTEHRDWYKATFTELLRPLELADPARVADDLMLLRDGALVAGNLGDPATVAASLYRSSQAVIVARTSGRRSPLAGHSRPGV